MENNLGIEHSCIAITPNLSPTNISSYINYLESIISNPYRIEFLIIRNKSLNEKEYKKLAKKIMELLNGKLPCILHFDNLDSFIRMDNLVSESYGVHFTSSLLKKLNKNDLHKYFDQNKIFGGSCHNEKEIYLATDLGLNYCILGPVKDKLLDEKVVTKGIGWNKFSIMAKQTSIRTFAIGGLDGDDLEIASKQNACGVAGISMFNQSS
tara:strand:- start:564 stop:1190 length:627 start_codon:yes stop_codon:yes gene_type:complete